MTSIEAWIAPWHRLLDRLAAIKNDLLSTGSGRHLIIGTPLSIGDHLPINETGYRRPPGATSWLSCTTGFRLTYLLASTSGSTPFTIGIDNPTGDYDSWHLIADDYLSRTTNWAWGIEN
jgi:hypothetical protein